MKISILYYSKSGHTADMANEIQTGMARVDGIEVGVFPIDQLDTKFVNESKAVVFGTPTYVASTCWQLKKWFDEDRSCDLSGKLGAAFATANYQQGGADIAINTLLTHMVTRGMMVYSGGAALGQPFIHLGAVAIAPLFEESREMFRVFGERIASKARELFGA